MKKIILGLVLLAVGISLFLLGKHLIGKAKASTQWPSTTGIIVESSVTQSREYDSSRRKYYMRYKPLINYEYTVDGKKYVGDKVSFGGTGTSRASAYNLIDKYPTRAEVTVYYDPEKPLNAVLETGVSAITYIPFYLGLFVAICGALIVLAPIIKLGVISVIMMTRKR
ncbi:MAG: DUF3592 domain-containing protein [Elusimicrobia bacterium]|nr:DUF3592 domain-containing protein [Elusimicrobiota bacterium]MBD3411949.1 DUF3592 domain-containing protein [Elusimicrobiota bacterium]